MIPEFLSWEPILIALGLCCLACGVSFLAVGFWVLMEYSGGHPRD